MREDTLTQLMEGSLVSESRLQFLTRTGKAAPQFLQGVYPFVGGGIVDLAPLNRELSFEVPRGKSAEVLYIRAGNSSDELVYLALMADGRPIRYIPLGPSANQHVPLAIVESHPAGTLLEVWLGAPKGVTGVIVIDVGLVVVQSGA